ERMTFGKLNSHLLQPIRDVGLFRIGAGDTESQIDQHLGNTRHADAANANKMDVLNSSKHKVQNSELRTQDSESPFRSAYCSVLTSSVLCFLPSAFCLL